MSSYHPIECPFAKGNHNNSLTMCAYINAELTTVGQTILKKHESLLKLPLNPQYLPFVIPFPFTPFPFAPVPFRFSSATLLSL